MVNWIIGIPLLTLFASVALAIIVIPSTRREPARSTLNILLVLIVLWSFCSVMFHSITFPSSLFWIYSILGCGLCTGAVGVHFSAQFTKQTGKIVTLAVRTIYILTLAVFILLFSGTIVEGAGLLPSGAVEVKFGPLAPIMWGLIGSGILTALAILISTFVVSSHSERRHTIFPVLGFIIMCFGGLSNIIVSSYPVDIAANFIFISFITYGVASSRIIRPAHMQPLRLTIPVIALMLALCYAAVVVFCLKWLGTTTGASHLIAAIAVTIFGSITFHPSRMFLSNKLAQFFFPNIYRYQKALSDIARVDRSLTQWTNSVINILNIIAKATSADDAVLLLQNSKTKYFEAKYAVGRDPASILHLGLPIDSPIVKALVERGTALSTEEIEQQITLKVPLRNKDDILQEIDSTLYCGVQGYDGLLAIIGLTHKLPHVWDRMEDRDFLELASYQIAPLIINANLYQESQLEIEERKQIEEKIKHAAEEWRTTFDSITDLVSIHDKDFKLVRVNKAFADALKMKPRELIGKTCYEIVHEANEPVPNCPHKKTTETKKPAMAEFFEPHLGIYLEVSTSPIFNKEGEVMALVHVARDITQRKQAEETLRESEERYRTLLELGERIGEAVVMLQNDERGTGMHIFVSDQWSHITRYSREELLNMSMADLIHPRDREMAVERYERRLRGEVLPGLYEITIVRKDGTEVPVEVVYAYTEYKDKAANVGYIRDITERKRAEEEILKFNKIADIATYGLSLGTPEGVMTYVNESFARMHGYTPGELIGKHFNVLYDEVQLKCMQKFREKLWRYGSVFAEEVWHTRKDRTAFPTLTSSNIVKDDAGNPLFIAGSVIDITERKKMEEQLIVTDRLASIGELSSGIAHELNNPLTSVIGFSDLLLGKKDLPDDVKEDLKVVNREAKRTAEVVRNLLIFARKHETEKKPVDIHGIIKLVLELRAYEQKLKNIEVHTRFASSLPEIIADGFQLQQVFLNIIINAEHFMVKEHGRGTLTITTERAGDIIRASFADDVSGILKDNLGHIFDPFFTTKEVGKGTGLGLSICHGIITEQGGRIYAESKAGKGATFIVELPISQW